MADIQETAEVITAEQLSSMDFNDRVNYFKSQKVIDLTEIPLKSIIHNADEFFQFLMVRLDDDPFQSRFPIIGMEDGRILMQGGIGPKYQHAEILRSIGQDPFKSEGVKFSTSLEGIDFHPRPDKMYLELHSRDLPPDAKIAIGPGSDIFTVPGYKNKENLEKVFGGIEGVTVHAVH